MLHKVFSLLKGSFFLIFFFFSGVVEGQNLQGQNLQGKVVDQKTQEPLVGATLILKKGTLVISTTAGFDGSYLFKNVSKGTYTLSVKIIGYQTVSKSIEISGTSTAEVIDFPMSSSEKNLKEVTISTQRNREMISLPGDPSVYRRMF